RSVARRRASRRPAGAAGEDERAKPRRAAEPRPDRAAALGRTARHGNPKRNGAAPTVRPYRDDGVGEGAGRGMAADRRVAARTIRLASITVIAGSSLDGWTSRRQRF